MGVLDDFGGNRINSDWLKENGPVKGIITKLALAQFEDDKSSKVQRRIEVSLSLTEPASLSGEPRTVLLNKTSVAVVKQAYGTNDENWLGRPLVVFFDPSVAYGGKLVGGVRVRIPKNNAKATPPPAAPPAETGTDDDDPFS